MTKNQAVEKVLKFKRLAEDEKGNPNERKVAAKRAADLMAKHHLTEDDLRTSGKVDAFDKLAEILGVYASKHPDLEKDHFGASALVSDLLGQAKKKLSAAQKASIVGQASQVLGIAKFILGDSNKTVNDLCAIVADVVKTCGA